MNNRIARVNEVIKRELSTLIAREVHLAPALLTVMEADTAPNLRQCLIYVSIVGTPGDKRLAMEKLEKKRVALQGLLAKRVILKYTPQLQFRLDDSIERGTRIIQILEQIESEIPPDESNDPMQEKP